MAQSGALALQELENTKAAELARAAQQKHSRRSIQKGGVLYADEARAMVLQKEQESVEKELQRAQRGLDIAQRTADNKVKKEWKAICTQMRKAVKDRKKRLKRWGILSHEIGQFILGRSYCM